jgi:hypothetical protein
MVRLQSDQTFRRSRADARTDFSLRPGPNGWRHQRAPWAGSFAPDAIEGARSVALSGALSFLSDATRVERGRGLERPSAS